MIGWSNLRVGRIALAAAAFLAAVGCDQSATSDGLSFPFLSDFGAQADRPVAMLLSNSAWWEGFGDPVLDDLIARSLRDSLTLQAAQERVVRARSEARSLPSAGMVSSSADARLSGDGDGAELGLSSELGLSWMLDPYGLRRNQVRIAEARTDQAAAEADAARLLVLFNLANAYAELRHAQRLVALGHAELQSRQNTLAQTRTLVAAESATRLDIARTEARVAEIRAELPGREAAVAARINEIAVLIGTAPGTLPKAVADALTATSALPEPELSPDVGIPADLLRSRPDIRISEAQYYAALAEVGVAQAARFPRLSLSGAISLDTLGSSTRGIGYYFGPTVQFPTLPLESAEATIDARRAGLREAHTLWTVTVLDAILEVENALLEYHAASQALRSANQASRLYREALGLTQEVYRRDEATLSDLIGAEQSLANANRLLADLRHRHALSFIELNIRLGTGEAAASAP